MNRILITGMGIVSALGNSVGETLQSLRENRSGIASLRYLKTAHTEFPVGEVKMTDGEMTALLNIPENVPTTRTALMGMLAVREALASAGLAFSIDRRGQLQSIMQSKESPLRIALVSGTTVGGMDKSERFYLDFLENDTKNAYISTHDCGACTEKIADYFDIFSQVDTVSTSCSSAANAILLGAELLKNDRADIVVAGGSECITKFHLNGFNTLMILDKAMCRPFDATRAGLNLGEGAAYVVMQRGRDVLNTSEPKPLCELSGYANTCDAFHQTASSPDGEGAYLAMKCALENAGLQPADIDYINAHGTGTQNNDMSEGRAIMRLFGHKIPPVSSTKAFTGHTTSASGGVEAVISILALQHDFIPINLNFSEKMAELPFTPYIKMENSDRVQKSVRTVLSNSFGFGGNDTSLIFSKTL
ncbi:MAG: beta-ketoacyl-[acyl-carrier-protein] synthase family protein [Prevotellaceae bacterium]|jgi:3-oxoacyl-[acyl-carrier-protein] synthase-1|nr:beta-ketoacyl-[acyl-carrier-protein] synthase family protein [Prevotellaceae bacterium]